MGYYSDNKYTFYLFTSPSFLEGVARLVDFRGSLNVYNVSETSEEADTKAISNDWKAVGFDLTTAIETYGRTANVTATKK